MPRLTVAFLQETINRIRREHDEERRELNRAIATEQRAHHDVCTALNDESARVKAFAARADEAEQLLKLSEGKLRRLETKTKRDLEERLSDVELAALAALVTSELRQETPASKLLRTQLENRGLVPAAPSPWASLGTMAIGAAAMLGLGALGKSASKTVADARVAKQDK